MSVRKARPQMRCSVASCAGVGAAQAGVAERDGKILELYLKVVSECNHCSSCI